jgi:tetratricopeptide (TPR) repeat protein
MKGYVKTKIKKLDEAETAVKTALESSYLSENLLLRLGLADIQKQKKDWKGILENCSKARFATNGGQLQVLLLLTKRRALALERLGHPADAIESISTAVKQFEFKGDIRLADLYLQRAALLHKVGKEKEALADREKAAQISSEIIPFSSELWPREAKTGKH